MTTLEAIPTPAPAPAPAAVPVPVHAPVSPLTVAAAPVAVPAAFLQATASVVPEVASPAASPAASAGNKAAAPAPASGPKGRITPKWASSEAFRAALICAKSCTLLPLVFQVDRSVLRPSGALQEHLLVLPPQPRAACGALQCRLHGCLRWLAQGFLDLLMKVTLGSHSEAQCRSAQRCRRRCCRPGQHARSFSCACIGASGGWHSRSLAIRQWARWLCIRQWTHQWTC